MEDTDTWTEVNLSLPGGRWATIDEGYRSPHLAFSPDGTAFLASRHGNVADEEHNAVLHPVAAKSESMPTRWWYASTA